MLDKKELDHLALLSRLALSDDDKKKFQKQLSEILDFVQILQQVDTSAVEPLHQISEQVNVWRDDVEEECANRDSLVVCAPESEKNLIKTPAIFSKSNEKNNGAN